MADDVEPSREGGLTSLRLEPIILRHNFVRKCCPITEACMRSVPMLYLDVITISESQSQIVACCYIAGRIIRENYSAEILFDKLSET
jgi:hypothetical protein